MMARCKKQVEEASVQYAFMNATPVTTKADILPVNKPIKHLKMRTVHGISVEIALKMK